MDKIEQALGEIFKIINENKMNIPEMLTLYGNLGYHMGASIAGISNQVPPFEEIQTEYVKNPTVDLGLLIHGLVWIKTSEEFVKNPKLSRYYITPSVESKKKEE